MSMLANFFTYTHSKSEHLSSQILVLVPFWIDHSSSPPETCLRLPETIYQLCTSSVLLCPICCNRRALFMNRSYKRTPLKIPGHHETIRNSGTKLPRKRGANSRNRGFSVRSGPLADAQINSPRKAGQSLQVAWPPGRLPGRISCQNLACLGPSPCPRRIPAAGGSGPQSALHMLIDPHWRILRPSSGSGRHHCY